jgi:periplasmic protein TonB
MFEAYQPRRNTKRLWRWVTSLAASSTLIGGGVGIAIAATHEPKGLEKKAPVEVVFRPPPPPKPALHPVPPPPAPKTVPRPKAIVAEVPAAAAAPVPAAAPMEAPKQLPTDRPKEAAADEAVAAQTVAVGGSGDGSGSAVGGGSVGPEEGESAAPVAAAAVPGGPITLPEDAEPADCSENEPPQYPEAARSTGIEGKVVLKVVVERDGRVANVRLMKGDQPFADAAIAAISRWTCTPASLDGTPISVYRVINVPFTLRND